MAKIDNISLRKYLRFLEFCECKCYRTTDGHQHYSRSDLKRPLTLQTHIDPVPAFIIRQHLRYLNISIREFYKIIDNI